MPRTYLKTPTFAGNGNPFNGGYLMTIAQNATAVTADDPITLPFSLEFDLSRGVQGAAINICRVDESAQNTALNNTYGTAGSLGSGEYYIATVATYELGDNTEADDITLITGWFDLYQIQPNWRSWVAAGFLPGMLVYDATGSITADAAIDLPTTFPKLAVNMGLSDCIFGITRTKLSDYAGGGTTPTYDNSTLGTNASLATGEYCVIDEDTIEIGDNLEAEDLLFIHGWWDYHNLYPTYRNRLTKNIQPLTQVLRPGVVTADAAMNLTATINSYIDMKQGAQDTVMNVLFYDASGDTAARQNTWAANGSVTAGKHTVIDYNTIEIGATTALHDLVFLHAWVNKWNLAYK